MASGNGSRKANASLLVIANILLPLSILVFGVGFFPYKPYLPGLAHYEKLAYGLPPIAPFDKLVFMVVDALRSDFVFSQGSGFEYTQSLIRDGLAMPFTANARSPTVTMPRLKAITTGSIPSFVDLILNFDEADTSSTLAAQDTWLAQIKATKKGKMLLFGDDTWLKLFPGTFDRHDGTTSFFVSDFTEVDTNVTRNIAPELENKDWGLMVLHYLEDRVANYFRSTNMVPKQKEMDGIVRSIFRALETKDHLKSTLFVLCGDHGMNDAGNHGASSPGETSPALVFMSPKFKGKLPKLYAPAEPKNEFDYYTMVEQSDIAPTIAALLGFPVSKNNLGAFIPEFLPFWSSPLDQVQILVRNGKQILDIVTATFGVELFELNNDNNKDPCLLDRTDINNLACEWQRLIKQAGDMFDASQIDPEWLNGMLSWLRNAQELMSGMASNYDLSKLALGLGLAAVATVSSIIAMLSFVKNSHVMAWPISAVAVLYGVMMFASSFVEEEQHFWYWTLTIWIAYLGVTSMRRRKSTWNVVKYLLCLSVVRLVKAWNQTGQKFAGEPDIVKSFISPNPSLLWGLIILSYVASSVQLMFSVHDMPYLAVTSITSVIASSAFAFKLAFTAEDAPELVTGFAKILLETFRGQSLLSRARVVFVLLAIVVCFAIYQARRGGSRAISSAQLVHHAYTILAMTQSRATNVPLLFLSTIILQCLASSDLSVAEISTTSILMQYASFFASGGSNAISSVDLSNAYNGIQDFNIIAVGVLTFISNWAVPVFWVSATNLLLVQQQHKQQHQQSRSRPILQLHFVLLTFFTTASTASVMAACAALRTHLFIWTVFSPKYLYCAAWSLAQHLAINIGLGSLLFALGTVRSTTAS
ncbi:hypothetical protein E4U21_003801 [Claviceps maximensis]|nr:hypothetical protein E4U21_003801 [Claviceps maximensis]